ncbi:MAG: hypothetical protein ACUVSX_10155 [Aggregatilineales bacterium]
MTRSDKLAAQLAGKLPVQTECRTIWLSLSDAERQVLKAACGLAAFQRSEDTEAAVRMLAGKSLLRLDKNNSLLSNRQYSNISCLRILPNFFSPAQSYGHLNPT